MRTILDAFELPSISDERLSELMMDIRPVVLHGGAYHEIAAVDPRRTAFTWDPKILAPVDMREVRRIKTRHGCAYYGFFKPSIAEVLAEINADPGACDGVSAFCIDTSQCIDVYRCGNGHRVTTILLCEEPQP